MRRSPGRTILPFLAALVLAATAAAQEPAAPPVEPSAKERARQQRIEEYLRKKEERIARDEAKAAVREEPAPAPDAAAPAPEPQDRKTKSKLPKALAAAQQAVWQSSLAQDPTVRAYLERVDRQEASPQQLAAFGNFVSDGGMPHEALEYYRAALGIEESNPTLWLNYGTLQRQIGDMRGALSSYGRALSLSPNHALAHYNVGTVLDAQGEYDEAIEAFVVALRIDPSLGNPASNPQAANNDRLVAAKLKLYQETAGRLSLPLSDVPGGEIEEPEAEPEPAGEPPPD